MTLSKLTKRTFLVIGVSMFVTNTAMAGSLRDDVYTGVLDAAKAPDIHQVAVGVSELLLAYFVAPKLINGAEQELLHARQLMTSANERKALMSEILRHPGNYVFGKTTGNPENLVDFATYHYYEIRNADLVSEEYKAQAIKNAEAHLGNVKGGFFSKSIRVLRYAGATVLVVDGGLRILTLVMINGEPRFSKVDEKAADAIKNLLKQPNELKD